MEPGLWYKASAPGSMMLFGEHAVLHHYPALVMALNRRISVTLIPRNDSIISISSSLSNFKCTLESLAQASHPALSFVLATLQYYQNYQYQNYRVAFLQGFDLIIDSEFSEKIGFGSSAAVVVATVAVMEQWLEKNSTEIITEFTDLKAALHQTAHRIIKQVQGTGSGADVAASIYGGVLYYRQNRQSQCRQDLNPITPIDIIKFEQSIPLTVIYSGSKTPTPEVIKAVQAQYQQTPELFTEIFHTIGQCTEKARLALNNQDWPMLGNLMNIQHGLLSALGVSNKALENIVHNLRTSARIWGAKLSGAGLGDCVIGLGESDEAYAGDQIFIQTSMQGFRNESKITHEAVIER